MYEIFIDDVEIIQNFLCVVQYQMCVTVFYSHDIQMHTEVENRCTDPFLQWFKSSIGIDCKCEFVCHIFFYSSSTFNVDNMYPILCLLHIHVSYQSNVLFEILVLNSCVMFWCACRGIRWKKGKFGLFWSCVKLSPGKKYFELKLILRMVIIELYLFSSSCILRFIDIYLVG